MEAKQNQTSNIFNEATKMNTDTAGAGAYALVISFFMLLTAVILYFNSCYFSTMLVIACTLVVYNEGSNIKFLISDIINILIKKEHIGNSANDIAIFSRAIRKSVQNITISGKTSLHEIKSHAESINKQHGVVDSNVKMFNFLSYIISEKKKNSKNYSTEELSNLTTTNFYQDAHEHYTQHITTLDFVGNSMPIFGLLGTIHGLIGVFHSINSSAIEVSTLMPNVALAMETTLYGAVFSVIFKVLASRFKKQRITLEYDYSDFVGGLELLYSNTDKIDIAE